MLSKLRQLCLAAGIVCWTGLCSPLCGTEVVLVHFGPALPSYLFTCVEQVRVWSPNVRITVLAEREALNPAMDQLRAFGAAGVALEDEPKSTVHQKWLAKNRLGSGFWNFATRRFLALGDYISRRGLRDVIHLENDNLLYVDAEWLTQRLSKFYPNMAATFDADKRVIPGIVYFHTPQSSGRLAAHLLKVTDRGLNDMESLADFYAARQIDHLPVLPKEYAQHHPLVNESGVSTKRPEAYSKHSDSLGGIFDAAAIGQYLGGISPVHNQPNSVGFINETAIYRADKMEIAWRRDDQDRTYPVVIEGPREYRIFNLHIHSKNLQQFMSR